jgi:flagellar motor component MotA
MDRYRIAGALLLSSLVVAAIMAGGSLLSFMHVPSVSYTVLGGAVAWVFWSGRELTTVRQALTAETPSVALLTRALTTAQTGRRALWAVTGLAMAISTVQILQSLDDLSAIGPLMATFLLSPLYACIADVMGIGVLEGKIIRRARALSVTDAVLDAAEASTRSSGQPSRARSRQTY